MKYTTKKSAKGIIDLYKDNTNYFNGHLSIHEMYDLLRNRMCFGSAETNVIIAALVLAGAKFTTECAE